MKDDPNIQETTRVVQIRDDFGHVRFCAMLLDMPGCRERHLVELDAYYPAEYPARLVTKSFYDLRAASDFFDDVVRKYSDLVKLESRDCSSVKAYADRIEYRRIHPDCCATCVFGRASDRFNSVFGRWCRMGHEHKMFCTNHEIFKTRPMDEKRPFNDRPAPDPGFKPRPFEPGLTPEVDVDGICKYFKRKRTK